MKKVSIMIPTFNQVEYIEQCIDSALAQDYLNLEVVISDDSSNGETAKIVREKYLDDSRVNYVHNIPALGRVRNYHKTLYERISGDYVLNLDGDDWLIDTNYITQAVNILNKHENVVCVMANKKKYYEDTNSYVEEKKYNLTLKPIMTGREYLYEYAVNKVSFSHMTTVYRRKEAIAIGFYDKDIILSDGESIFRLICNYNIAFISRVVGVWRGHMNNATIKQNDIYDLKDLYAIEDNVETYCKNFNWNTIGTLPIDKWSIKMKLKRTYPFIYSFIKDLSFYKLYLFLYRIYRYDKKLFQEVIFGVSNKIYISIKRKLLNG